MIDRALYLDQRSVEEAAEALLAISSLLEGFKQKNPGIFNQLCQDALEDGDMTLGDALDGVRVALEVLLETKHKPDNFSLQKWTEYLQKGQKKQGIEIDLSRLEAFSGN